MRKSRFITAVCGSVLVAAVMVMNAGISSAESVFSYDVDGNGIVNIMDMLHLKSYLLGEEKQENTETAGADVAVQAAADQIISGTQDEAERPPHVLWRRLGRRAPQQAEPGRKPAEGSRPYRTTLQ